MEKFDYTKTPGKKRIRFYSPGIEKALVSVITPFFNGGEYFEETFNSVMNQTFPWFEWIIVNDGSTNQEHVYQMEKLAETDDRIRVIHQQNGGLSCARNTGFQNANTGLVVPLDADDLISPQYLECLYWALLYHPEAAWAYSDTYGFSAQEYKWKHPFSAERMKRDNILVATAMIRKKDYDDVGGYKVEKMSYNEDWRFWLDMLGLHKRPVHIGTELFWYRRLEKGMLSSIKVDRKRVEFNAKIIEKAAAQVDGSVEAMEYPVTKSEVDFPKPPFRKWEEKSNPDKKGKRILWLIPWMVMGGADKFNLDAIAGLSKMGYENSILTTLPSENEWRQKFEDYTDEIFCMSDFLDPAHYAEFVAYFIQSRQIDVLFVTNAYDGYYMLPWLRMHFPDLVIMDYVHMEEWYWRAGGHARTSGALNGIVEKTYVCNSATRQVMIESFQCPEESVECMYIGVDHRYFDRKNEKEGYLHKETGIDEKRPIVLFPCRIHEQKRPFMLLDIADGVKEVLPEAAFVVVGDGPQLNELRETIKDRKLDEYVFCIGRSSQMRACYRDSALTVICSLKEGLALTAYESCAMGVPVVSSDVGGQKDLIGEAVGALVPLQQSEKLDLNKREFPKDEVKQYVDHITRILKDKELRENMAKNCREKIESGFSLDKMVEHFDGEIQRLCADPVCKERRNYVSAMLRAFPNHAADYYTIYCEWKRKTEESEDTWCSHTWYAKEYQRLEDGIKWYEEQKSNLEKDLKWYVEQHGRLEESLNWYKEQNNNLEKALEWYKNHSAGLQGASKIASGIWNRFRKRKN